MRSLFLRALALVLILLLLDALYLWSLMPDWQQLARGSIPKSAFILAYEERLKTGEEKAPLRWQPLSGKAIAPSLARAVVVAEDARFYEHEGIDLLALKDAWRYNIENQRFALGGSTMSQQLAKNLFLSPSRDPLRKWHELWLTLLMEHYLSKQRILELYLNVVEFGPGIYGAQAASLHYWGKPASQLNLDNAIELAATLSSPKKSNPKTRSAYFLRKKQKISGFLGVSVK